MNCKKFVTTIDTARILEEMAEFFDPKGLNYEDSLESLLDEESDEEFGLPKFQEHFADSLTPAVLKDWSAKDFASIYVRFRPHLERHAKRFLNNSSQVEEVVQDAFLYLMTALPDLDSELGVLRFLKWETRLLALDVIRANSRVSLAPLDEHGEFEANIPEISQDLERADDAAIVSLALAKLQPRHREALIATLYEEKGVQVVSAQMGLSENAFRQLLFRSRAAFKKALIGEAETAGLSMSGILSLAARKAAADSGKIASVAGAFLLVLAVSFGVIPNLASTTSEEIVSQPQIATPPGINSLELIPDEGSGPSIGSRQLAEDESVPLGSGEIERASNESDLTQPQLTSLNEAIREDDVAPKTEEENPALAVLRASLDNAAAQSLVFEKRSSAALEGSQGNSNSIALVSETGVKAFVIYNSEEIKAVWLEIQVNGDSFVSSPKSSLAQQTTLPDGTLVLDYVATDLLIGDTVGSYDFRAVEDSEVSRLGLSITLKISQDGNLLESTFGLAPNNSQI